MHIKDNSAKYMLIAGQKVHRGLVKATLMVERDAKILCPVKTGTLKRSITHEFKNKNFAIVGSNIKYAPHIELGTYKMSAQPYLRPALHKNLGAIKRLLNT